MLKFFTSRFHAVDSRTVRRLILLNFIILIGASTHLFFMFFNYFRLGNDGIALLNGLSVLASVAIFLDLRVNNALERSSYLALAGFFIFVIFFVNMNQNVSFGLIWTQVFPLMCIGIIGYKRGTIISLIYLAIVFFLAFRGIGVWDGGEWDLLSFLRLVLASGVMLFIIIAFDVALEHSYDLLERQSVTDELTRLYNRRKIMEIVTTEVDRAVRYGHPVSIILFDVDNFKMINDNHGHQGGDTALKKISALARESLRRSDYIGRWGGEEFLIVCPETSIGEAETVAEKLRRRISGYACGLGTLSCSFGVSEFEKEQYSIDDFIHHVDMAMYRAKESGKNRVCR